MRYARYATKLSGIQDSRSVRYCAHCHQIIAPGAGWVAYRENDPELPNAFTLSDPAGEHGTRVGSWTNFHDPECPPVKHRRGYGVRNGTTLISSETHELLSAATDLDDLMSLLLQDPDILEDLVDRDELEDIEFIPTFGGEDAADVGGSWEVLSWDATRILYLQVSYDVEDRQVDLVVRVRATAEQETD